MFICHFVDPDLVVEMFFENEEARDKSYDYSHADWDSLLYHLKDVPWEDMFNLSASAVATEFCEWVQVGIDVYIPHCKYQVKPHSFPWFSDACAADIVLVLLTLFICTNINFRNLK